MALGEAFLTVRADTSEFAADLEKLRPILDAFKATINVTANLDRFTRSVNDAAAAASRITAMITIDANTGRAVQRISDLVAAIEETSAVVDVLGDTDSFALSVQRAVGEADSSVASVKVSADISPAELKLAALLAEIRASGADVKISAATSAALGVSTAPSVLTTGLSASQTRGAVDLSTASLAAYADEAKRAAEADVELGVAAAASSGGIDKQKKSADDAGISLRQLLPLAISVGVALAPLAISAAAAAGAVVAAVNATQQYQSAVQALGSGAANALVAISNEGAGSLGVLTGAAESLRGVAVNTTAAVQALSDVFAKSGETGKTLSTSITSASSALAALSNQTDITNKNFASSVAGLGLGVTPAQVFAALRSELDLTQAQLDKILTTTGLQGNAVARAALAAATSAPGVAGATQNAVNTSPEQALESLKSSVSDALINAINPADLAAQIGKVKAALVGALSGVGPEISAFADSALKALTAAIPPLLAGIKALIPEVSNVLGDISSFVHDLTTSGTFVNNTFTSLVQDIRDLGAVAGPVVSGLLGGLGELVQLIQPILDLLAAFAHTTAGKTLLEVAGAIGAIVLAAKGFAVVTTAIKAVGDASIIAAGKIGLIETAEEGAAGAGALAKWGGLAEAIGGVASSLGLVVVAGGLAGAAVAKALNAITPQGFSNKDELPAATYTAGIQALQSEINKFSDANLRAQLTNIVQSSLAANDGADHFSGAIVAAQKAVADFSTAHGVQQSQALATALAALPKETNLSVDVDTSAGIANLRALALAGVAAANAVLLAQENSAAANAAFQQGPDSTAGGLPIDQAGFSSSSFTAPAASVNPADFTGTGTGTGGASAAATKITTAKNAIASALTSLVDTIGGANTVAAVDAAFKSLQDVLDKNEKILGQKEPAGLKAYIAKEKTALEDLARQQELIASAISAAASQTSSALSFADTVTASATTGVADLSKLTLITTGATAAATAAAKLGLVFTSVNENAITAAKTGKAASAALSAVATASPSDNGFLAGLQTKLAQLQQFAADINAAQKAGLDPSLVQQFLAAGPGSDPQLKSILASGTQNLAAINSTQKAITAAANALGDEAAKSTLAAGVAVADGFIQGLEAQSDKLTAAATKLGNLIAAAVKKALGIKSPSVVMRALGVHAGTGLHLGLADTLPHIQAVALRMAKAAQPVMGATALERARGMELTGVAGSTVTNSKAFHAPITVTQNITGGNGANELAAHLTRQLSRLAR